MNYKGSRCSGTMTESQWLAWVRSALRSKWLRWKPRSDALKAAQVAYKGDNKRRQYSYKCAICNELFAQKEVEVDHYPRDAGSILSVEDIGNFCNNLFCETDNLRVLCKNCHAIYTLSRRMNISFDEAKVVKEALAFIKNNNKKEILAFLQQSGYNGSSVSNDTKRRELVIELFEKGKRP